ncbi:MAG: hypothetical protein GX452_09270 [Ignavibacteriales bacterium]|nr:hypothetical protein [Ignavibacteriales bacterium]HOJ17189.1 hypothetical protein [Ignavibacteriaceae bacterium]HPO54378.1 hypothetical protein [Ignavibacteriaceae bacterium]
MKYKFLVVAAVLFFTTAFASALFDYFHAKSDGSNIKLEWKTGEENNLRHFVIERKSVNTDYIQIATIAPKGSNSFYSFYDENAYKTSSGLVFVYRVKIVENDNSFSYSKEVSVSHAISGVKRTWGSIKAMFR